MLKKETLDKSVIFFEKMFFLRKLSKKFTKQGFEEYCKENKWEDDLQLYKTFCQAEKKAGKAWKKMMAEMNVDRKREMARIRNVKMNVEEVPE